MSSGTVSDTIADLKRKRSETRAALATARAAEKRLKRQEDAESRKWVLPEDSRWRTCVSQVTSRGGPFKSRGRRGSSSCGRGMCKAPRPALAPGARHLPRTFGVWW